MSKTTIEWTDHSINPFRARLNGRTGHYCEKVSPGCRNCYSSALQRRFGMPSFQEQRRSDVEHYLDARKLEQVLRRRKPTKYFWCDMTDMFGDWVPFEWIAACFGVMAATPQHTHQVLTKRPDRAGEWFRWVRDQCSVHCGCDRDTLHHALVAHIGNGDWEDRFFDQYAVHEATPGSFDANWPLPNLWLGVSVEDQQRAHERIPLLLDCPAAVKWLSVEPLLGPVDLDPPLCSGCGDDEISLEGQVPWCMMCDSEACYGHWLDPLNEGIAWVVVGSESGPRAREMKIEWARSIVDQCDAASVAVFTKQIANEHDRKGGNPEHWPVGNWPRQYPEVPA